MGAESRQLSGQSDLDRKLAEAREAADSAETEARERDPVLASVVFPLAEAIRALADAVREMR